MGPLHPLNQSLTLCQTDKSLRGYGNRQDDFDGCFLTGAAVAVIDANGVTTTSGERIGSLLKRNDNLDRPVLARSACAQLTVSERPKFYDGIFRAVSSNTILVLPCSRLLPQIFLNWLSTVCLAIDWPMPGFKKFHQPSELPFDTANKWP